MAKFSTQGKPASRDINVTPLIDVVLVLLIIFMVITPIYIYEMAINMPQTKQVVSQSKLSFEPAKAAVCEDGSYAFNGQIMELEEVEAAIIDNLATRSQLSKERGMNYAHVVFVDGHPNAPYPNMLRLMDTVMKAKAEKIGIAKLKTEEGEFDACGTGS